MIIQSIHFTLALEDGGRAEAIVRELREFLGEDEGVVGFEGARGFMILRVGPTANGIL